MDQFPVHTKGFLCRLFSISPVEPEYLRPLLGYFIFAEPPEAMDHRFNPPIASYSTENTIRSGAVVHLRAIVIGEITKSEFWKEVQKAEQKFVEMPFSLKLTPSELGPCSEAGEHVSLSGAIDLVYKGKDGWRIIDYKTDDVSEDVDEFVSYYAPQIKAYSRFLAGDNR